MLPPSNHSPRLKTGHFFWTKQMTDYTLYYLALGLLAAFIMIMLDIMGMDKKNRAQIRAWKLRDKAYFAMSQKQRVVL